VREALARAGATVGSFGVAVALLVLLMGNVLYGTFAQGWMSLYDVQRLYFESWFCVFDVYGVPVPWPGAMLILSLLSVNLLVGGVIRLKKRRSTAGILIGHLGVLLLFGGSLVESMASDKGQMTVWEGDAREEFQSYDQWEIVVRERDASGGAREWILPNDEIEDLSRDDLVRFRHEGLPFDVAVTGWERNSEPRLAGRGTPPDQTADGWVLAALAPSTQNDVPNLPGCWVTLVPKEGGAAQRTLLWGGASRLTVYGDSAPWVASVAGRRFEVDLRARRWTVPFRIELTKFVNRYHPGTNTPAEYSSYVRKHEDGTTRDVHITMNEPFRHRGYTFYQSSFGPSGPDGPGGPPWYSTFAVVRNPSDKVPLVACLVIALGLLTHFVGKLFRHLSAEAARRHAARSAA
jgi:hypothetical protein